jgi:DNA-binding NarL/FixJ family response regulator
MIRLATRDKDLIKLVMEGLGNKQIAFRLGLTEATVRVYMTRLLTKLRDHDIPISNRTQLAMWAERNHVLG